VLNSSLTTLEDSSLTLQFRPLGSPSIPCLRSNQYGISETSCCLPKKRSFSLCIFRAPISQLQPQEGVRVLIATVVSRKANRLTSARPHYCVYCMQHIHAVDTDPRSSERLPHQSGCITVTLRYLSYMLQGQGQDRETKSSAGYCKRCHRDQYQFFCYWKFLEPLRCTSPMSRAAGGGHFFTCGKTDSHNNILLPGSVRAGVKRTCTRGSTWRSAHPHAGGCCIFLSRHERAPPARRSCS
jgi:hypothetical protein